MRNDTFLQVHAVGDEGTRLRRSSLRRGDLLPAHGHTAQASEHSRLLLPLSKSKTSAAADLRGRADDVVSLRRTPAHIPLRSTPLR